MSAAAPARAWVFGDNIDTDVLAPGHLMKLAPDDLARHCLEAVNPDFAPNVRPGDVLIAGRNFGLGSSREQAAVSLKRLGLKAVIARSFARIFFRNAINLGLPAFAYDADLPIADGDPIALDVPAGRLDIVNTGGVVALPALAPALTDILDAGGLMPLLERRLKAERSAT
ncbi:MAG: 3-isopropylmalate dehydratase [Pseudomonadota bacterium]